MAGLADYTGLIVGAAGAASAAYATWISARAQRRSADSTDRAASVQGAESLINLLQNDNATLRGELTRQRQETTAQLDILNRDARAREEQLHRMTKAMIGLRAIVLDEVARESARDVLGHVDPDMHRDTLRELLAGPDGLYDERRADLGPPPGTPDRRGIDPDDAGG